MEESEFWLGPIGIILIVVFAVILLIVFIFLAHACCNYGRLKRSNFQKATKLKMATSSCSKTNRLANEKSPYLLQHAHNPVDWYPWGKEAFEKARNENKMIFLSVGYSTCHWCHVMERESFENADVGRLMNESFVCIKVDREERPDVDKMYMGFVQATTGSGGWPMSVWLTPDLKPVVGGTYFPPDDRYYGRPGFSSILKKIADKWKTNSQAVASQGSQILDAIKTTTGRTPTSTSLPNVNTCADTCYQMLQESYDTQWGGFSSAPKFPQPVNLEFLLYFSANKNETDAERESALRMVGFTEKMMAKGGIHDHVAHGFHRYSTDGEWHVPHFEKMLYDQGQLAAVYADMFRITKDELFYGEILRDILTYADRDLGHQDGGFYSAEDADSLPTSKSTEKKEGAFCVWTEAECRTLLNKSIKDHVTLADLFCKHYNVKTDGNVDPYQDPHKELTGQNVLINLCSLNETAEQFGLDPEAVKTGLEEARKILFEARSKRPKPHLDTKLITAWNALMISGFAKASAALNDPSYAERAKKAANFIKTRLYNAETKSLLRSCYVDDQRKLVQISEPIDGFADDYTFLIAALLDVYEFVDFDDRYLTWAHDLQVKMDDLFWDADHNSGYFQSSANDASILIRMKEDQDGAEPSGNSVAVLNLLRLANLLDESKFRDRAKSILLAFSDRLKKYPVILPKMMCGFLLYEKPSNQIVIVGSRNDNDVKAMSRLVRSEYLPYHSLILLDNEKDVWLKSKNDHLKHLQSVDGKATVYVCQNFACSLPVQNVDDLKTVLAKSRDNVVPTS